MLGRINREGGFMVNYAAMVEHLDAVRLLVGKGNGLLRYLIDMAIMECRLKGNLPIDSEISRLYDECAMVTEERRRAS